MSQHHEQLDNFIIQDVGHPDEDQPGISRTEGMVFMVGLKKVAQDEASPAAPAEAAPDTTGQMEGEFAVPLEAVAQAMAQLISMLFKMKACYAYYREIVRGPDRDGPAQVFDRNCWTISDCTKYLLRRLSVLVPGGVPIPPSPMPMPMTDIKQIVQLLIAGEQQIIVLFRQLMQMVGPANPMHFTLAQTVGQHQESLDKLWQLMPAQGAGKKEPKIAGAIKVAKLRLVKSAQAQQPEPTPGAIVVPEPGVESPEQYMLRETQLALEQSKAETAMMAQRAQQLEQMTMAAQAEAQNAMAQAQVAQQQAEQSSAVAEQAQQASASAQEQAAAQAQNAAEQADAKMRLGIRIQQFRQQLADIVSSDPVQEEGVGFGEQAGPGTPATSQQQAAQQEQEAAQQAQAAAVDPKAAKELEQAAKAQDEAAQQTQQAAQATGAA